MQCYECKGSIPQDEVIQYNKHNYHPDCYEQVLARDQFRLYVCELFGLKQPGPTNWALRKQLNEKGIDDTGIVRTLKYMYEVKRMHVPSGKYKETIVLVEKYYCQAEDYWDAQKAREKRIANIMADALAQEKTATTIVAVSRATQRKPTLLSIEEPEGDS